MSNNVGVLKLSGHRYDLNTGQRSTAKTEVSRPKNSARTIDGFIKPNGGQHAKGSLLHKAQNLHAQAQRSQTLMRSVVKKPIKLAQIAKSSEPRHSSETKSPNLVSPRRLFLHANKSERISYAKSVQKHPKVNRFGRSGAPLPKSQQEPAPKPMKKLTAASSKTAVSVRPVAAASTPVMATSVKPLPSMVTSVSHHQLEKLLDQALEQADAHKQALKQQLEGHSSMRRLIRRHRWLIIGLTLLVVGLAGGFLAYKKIPSLGIKIASYKTGVNASVPAYNPTGFAYSGPVNSTASVSLNYQSKVDKTKRYTITQQSSNMDSASLLSNLEAQNNQNYQTLQDNHGGTIYIYGPNNEATWVSHGILYKLKGNAKLNSEQIQKIASSL